MAFNLFTMEQPVLCGDLRDVEWIFEDFSPLENNVEVSLKLSKLFTAADCLRQHPNEVSKVTSKLHDMEALDIFEGSLKVVCERLQISHAAFKLSAVIIACKTVEEAGHKIRHEGIYRW